MDFNLMKTTNYINKNFNEKSREDRIKLLVKIQQQTQMIKKNEDIEIKPSKYGGRGIFTKREYKTGDIITKYSPYIIFDKKDSSIFIPNSAKATVETGPKIMKKYDDYLLNMGDDILLFGNPNWIQNEDYLGHMPNDRGYNPRKIYRDLSNSQFNFIFVVATRDIRKGEEITTYYGKNYWFNPRKEGKPSRHLEIKQSMKKT
tara:strand:- start:1248 stop:1853 length:606 start_codon:yes stop_codon:yes gene_type:complete